MRRSRFLCLVPALPGDRSAEAGDKGRGRKTSQRGSRNMSGKYRFLRRMISLLLVITLLSGSAVSAAEYSFAYPTSKSKKGLYVCPGMEEDALELGIMHTTINLSVGDFMPSSAYRNSTHCIGFKYEGKTYWFAKNAIARYDDELERLSRNGVIVTAILLLPNRSDDLQNLIYPSARGRRTARSSPAGRTAPRGADRPSA